MREFPEKEFPGLQNVVIYSTETKEGTKLIERKQVICYGDFFNRAPSPNTYKVSLFTKVKKNPYSQNDIRTYISDINEFGMPCSYEGIKDEKDHVFTVIMGEDGNRFKHQLAATLTSIRYLWEVGLNSIPWYYFEILQEVPGITKFEAFWMAHSYRGSMSHYPHCLLQEETPYAFMKLEDFIQKISLWDVFEARGTMLNSLLETRQVNTKLTDPLERYKYIKRIST